MAAVQSECVDAGEPKIGAADAILVVEDVVKRFETPDGVLTAVDHVSLSVAPGEFVGVIGPSGCGKSTLFNVIGGLLARGDGGGRTRARAASCDRHDLPGGIDLPLAQRDRQRRLPVGNRGPAESRALRAGAPVRQARRARRLRAAVSRRAVGGYAAARVDG